MLNEIKRKNLTFKDIDKKLSDSLIIVGLPKNYLDRNIKTLSTFEKKLLQLSLTLLENPNIIILEEPFKNIDMKNEKRIILLLQKLKEKYQKTIIIASMNCEILYKYTNEIFLIKNDNVFVHGNPKEIYTSVEKLKRNSFSIPMIVEFVNLAKKRKKVKLEYHKDIRDLIKDIYKHVWKGDFMRF